MDHTPDFEDPLDAVSRVGLAGWELRDQLARIGGLSDADVLDFAREVEASGRIIDALRVRAAGEIAKRSQRLGDENLAARHGCRNGAELVERLTQAPTAEVWRRVRLDARTSPRESLTGETMPPLLPALAAAVDAGGIGTDAAGLISGMLQSVEHRSDPEVAALAEESLVDLATGSGTGALPATFAELKVHVQTWSMLLDQDGTPPDPERAAARRGITIGPLRDGLHRIHGAGTPELAAQLQRLNDAHGNPAVRFGTEPGLKDPDEPWTGDDVIPDLRTAAQKRHDVLLIALEAAARSEETPSLGGAAPTLLVHVALEDLVSPTGVATIDGIDTPAPAALAHRIACTGAVQKVVFDRAGRIVRLGTKERLFNHHQRRAITARDGGCVIPGCTIPAAWCEVHHVEDHAKGGPTHTDNGVLLCWWHHHTIDTAGWAIRMNRGVPEIKAPPWIDPRGIYRAAPSALTRRRARGRARPALRVGSNDALPV
ncbi:HNH endonuclease signature motif containing protein [Microbacterium rhizophilus]|uniref:HNH endonuclease signature motif containing protein n=1 Tax=Microbacterium rhizophilus TaxID=3138934 RepID=UPI0031E4E9A5